jgi:hypothetical protein
VTFLVLSPIERATAALPFGYYPSPPSALSILIRWGVSADSPTWPVPTRRAPLITEISRGR